MATERAAGLLLYSYWRSSSAYRVRIALNLKGIQYRQRFVHLVRDGGEQHRAEYREINPLGLVPAIVHAEQYRRSIDGHLRIPRRNLYGYPPVAGHRIRPRARVRSIAQSIASEIQPLNNLGVMNYLKTGMLQDDAAIKDWYDHWIARGFNAVESWLSTADSGLYCHGESPTLADCFLVPQVYNAERFSCDLEPYPHIRRITAQCRSLSTFRQAAPENQADAT